ncbi:hypothetical protein DL771_006245 [Monosporascus sp. 5C6A]|nr:hypothetical protein DL771_006245 [Monosporascus sp. 5C6A]
MSSHSGLETGASPPRIKRQRTKSEPLDDVPAKRLKMAKYDAAILVEESEGAAMLVEESELAALPAAPPPPSRAGNCSQTLTSARQPSTRTGQNSSREDNLPNDHDSDNSSTGHHSSLDAQSALLKSRMRRIAAENEAARFKHRWEEAKRKVSALEKEVKALKNAWDKEWTRAEDAEAQVEDMKENWVPIYGVDSDNISMLDKEW